MARLLSKSPTGKPPTGNWKLEMDHGGGYTWRSSRTNKKDSSSWQDVLGLPNVSCPEDQEVPGAPLCGKVEDPKWHPDFFDTLCHLRVVASLQLTVQVRIYTSCFWPLAELGTLVSMP